MSRAVMQQALEALEAYSRWAATFEVEVQACNAMAALRAALEAQQEPVTAREVAQQVFALCEHIESLPESPADSLALERFSAGQRFAAKQIRRGIGTWLTDEENVRAAAHPPAQPHGWVPAPQKATIQMLVAGRLALYHASMHDIEASETEMAEAWEAMMAARPQPKETT